MPGLGTKLLQFGERLAAEPPFRLVTNSLIQNLPFSFRTKSRWEAVPRPHYLVGIMRAAIEAGEAGVKEICVAEFGVAGGAGLLEMQRYAQGVEKETGIGIRVYGFDTGGGLPEPLSDHRDHPELWSAGDFPMDESLLRRKLAKSTELVLGDVKDTVPDFVRDTQTLPIGFFSIDVDMYSSTLHALRIISMPERKMLRRVCIYLDDTETFLYHKFAGELLAVEDFNEANQHVKIDRWRGLRCDRPFPNRRWIDRMYVAYDLEAMSRSASMQEGTLILDLSDPTGLQDNKIVEKAASTTSSEGAA